MFHPLLREKGECFIFVLSSHTIITILFFADPLYQKHKSHIPSQGSPLSILCGKRVNKEIVFLPESPAFVCNGQQNKHSTWGRSELEGGREGMRIEGGATVNMKKDC
jgi:hypothetical protein